MKKEILLGIAAFSMLIASCGGGDTTEGNGADSTAKDTIPTIVFTDYSVDTATTVFTWKAYGSDTSKYHVGTIKALDGTISASDSAGTMALTAGSLTIDMNSAKDSGGATDLDAHLKEPAFFDVNQFATSSFTFESFDGTTATGSLSIMGQTVAISAPAEVIITADNVTVNVSMFVIDFAALNMPYFIEDAKQKPAKQHNPKVEIWGTVVANKM